MKVAAPSYKTYSRTGPVFVLGPAGSSDARRRRSPWPRYSPLLLWWRLVGTAGSGSSRLRCSFVPPPPQRRRLALVHLSRDTGQPASTGPHLPCLISPHLLHFRASGDTGQDPDYVQHRILPRGRGESVRITERPCSLVQPPMGLHAQVAARFIDRDPKRLACLPHRGGARG